MKRQLYIALIVAGLCASSLSQVSAYFDTNFFRSHDIDFKTFEWNNKSFRIGAFTEYGHTYDCRDWNEDKRNVLQIYNLYQSSLAMLLGAPKNTTIYNLALKHTPGASPMSDDEYRGRFNLTGSYEEYGVTLFGKYKIPIKSIPGTWSISAYLPIKHIEIDDVSWSDQTKNVLAADLLFKADISDSLASSVQTLGNLNINEHGWSKTGLGDTTLILEWYKDHKQLDREYLKNVRIIVQLGLTIPTAEKKDEDQALAKSLGKDGAWGIPVRAGLHLDFIKHVCAGFELDLLGHFSTTKVRRLKTNEYQTDFLLLHKGNVTKSYGPEWRFHLFLQAKKLLPGLSAMAAYQFYKRDEDQLSPKSNDFNYNIINSAEGLKQTARHNAVFTLSYNPLQDKNSSIIPQVSVFYKLPILGQRSVLSQTFGGQIGLTF